MGALTDALIGLNLFFGAFVVGAMVLEFMMVLPALAELPPGNAVDTIKLFSPRAWRYLPASGAVSTLSALAALIVHEGMGSLETGLLAAALACVAGFLFMSAGLYRREDVRVRDVPAGAAPSDWPQALARLRRLHVARMGLYLTAYALFVVVAVEL